MADELQVIGNEYPVTSPTFGPSGDLFAVSSAGDIFRYSSIEGYENEFQMEAWGNSSGQPLGLDFDSQGVAFVCDAAHQAIFRIVRVEREGGTFAHQIDPYVKEYEQSQFLGPNSLCLSRQTGMLYFTDSGPLGETSLQNPRGSVFAISPSTQLLIPLCLNTLAHPCGVALSPDEKNIYVAETAMNRILRFTQHPPQVFQCSVFCQLSGRFGPTALAPATTALLFHVEIPATGFDCLLNFAVKPGVALQQVQQGITEVIDELAFRLASSVSEEDLQSNLDKYEVAKLECEQQLQDWQSKLSEASLSVLRADRSRNELSKLRESYWREVQSLRQQLYQKQQAEEQGEDFTPDSVDLFKTKQEDNENELLEQIDRMEEEHKAEIASWKQKNLELVEKLKAKALQAAGIHAKTSDASVQTDHPKLKDASSATDTIHLVSTSIQTIELEAPAMQIDMEVQTDFEESQTGEVEGEQAQAKPSKTRRRSVNGRSASGSRRMSSAPSKEKSRTRSIEVAKDSPDVLNSLEVSPDILGADTTDTSTQTDALSGTLQLIDVAVSATGDLYVAHFDFADNAEHGRIVVLNTDGEARAEHQVTSNAFIG
eukprot:symbB.v1.2.012480.t1/scaffold861.1/size176854/10